MDVNVIFNYLSGGLDDESIRFGTGGKQLGEQKYDIR